MRFSSVKPTAQVRCDLLAGEARRRSRGYALATQKALPNAVQVADRWHLMENASHAFLDAVRKSMRQIRAAIGATTINPALLTVAESCSSPLATLVQRKLVPSPRFLNCSFTDSPDRVGVLSQPLKQDHGILSAASLPHL
jgi:hypothetical protein